MNVGDKVKLQPPLQEMLGEVVDVFPAGKHPDSVLVERYYGIDHMDEAYKKLFVTSYGSQLYNRWIVKRTDGQFIVIPENHPAILAAVHVMKE